ncbi:TPA: hypothetical protein DCZ81_00755 [Candidatus Collierbacteria bacterium]|nr:hypothetical protein [Candidatus Collierbacteria bacterium]
MVWGYISPWWSCATLALKESLMNKRGVTDGCLVLVVPLVVFVFVAVFVFGLFFNAPLMQAVTVTLGTTFILVLIMLGIEIVTGIFHIEPPDDQRKTP